MAKKKKMNLPEATAAESGATAEAGVETAAVSDGTDAAEQPPEAADEHQVYLRMLDAYREASRKRDGYKKYGTLFVILSGVAFLGLIFSLDSKIDFLVLWVITDFLCAALMIRAEYTVHRYKVILGLSEDTDTADEEEKEEQDE